VTTSTFLQTRHNSSFGPLNRPQPNYPGHVPLNWFENAFLAAGSAVASLTNPRRGDMIAALGETTAGSSLDRLRDRMLASPEGRQILRDRPRVNSDTVDMNELRELPNGTFGHAYISWLDKCGVTPDTRTLARYIDDPELAYVMQRYRECHDFYHTICNLPVSVPGELALKFFEFANLGLPVAAISALFGPLRLNSHELGRLWNEYIPWAMKCGGTAQCLITVYWEKRWEMDISKLKQELGIWDAPTPHWPKPLSEARRAAQKKRERELAAMRRGS
jgi:ubiquinone biosynthesis protein COQ4